MFKQLRNRIVSYLGSKPVPPIPTGERAEGEGFSDLERRILEAQAMAAVLERSKYDRDDIFL